VSGNEVGQFIVLQQAVAIGIALLEYFFELRSLPVVGEAARISWGIRGIGCFTVSYTRKK